MRLNSDDQIALNAYRERMQTAVVQLEFVTEIHCPSDAGFILVDAATRDVVKLAHELRQRLRLDPLKDPG